MKRVWLHIGMHKTGTTSVQVNLANVRKPANWRYLSIGGSPNMGQALYAMFSPEPHKFHWFVKRGNSPEQVAAEGARLRRRLARVVSKCRKENIIISGEALTLIEREGIFALRDFLKPLCDEIRVIGYVRPPAAFKISVFQQRVKHGNDRFNIADIKLHYRWKFEKFDEAFGRENVLLRKFDPKNFPQGCIVADICEQIGIEGPECSAIRRANESLSREACGILYAYRKYGPGYGVGNSVVRENIRVIAALLAMRGNKFKVSRALVTAGLAGEAKDIRWMEKRLGVPLDEEIRDDGTEVTGEQDLLTIGRAACEDFAARFSEIHQLKFPKSKLPVGDPVDPRQVASFVEYCRGLCREQIQEERTLKRKLRSGKKRMAASVIRYIRRRLGGD